MCAYNLYVYKKYKRLIFSQSFVNYFVN